MGHLPWQTAGPFQKLTFAGHEPAMITRSATSKQPPGSARGNGQVHQGTECREMRLRLPKSAGWTLGMTMGFYNPEMEIYFDQYDLQ